MGKSTISMAIFNSYVKLPEGNYIRPMFVSMISPSLLSKRHPRLQGLFRKIRKSPQFVARATGPETTMSQTHIPSIGGLYGVQGPCPLPPEKIWKNLDLNIYFPYVSYISSVCPEKIWKKGAEKHLFPIDSVMDVLLGKWKSTANKPRKNGTWQIKELAWNWGKFWLMEPEKTRESVEI